MTAGLGSAAPSGESGSATTRDGGTSLSDFLRGLVGGHPAADKGAPAPPRSVDLHLAGVPREDPVPPGVVWPQQKRVQGGARSIPPFDPPPGRVLCWRTPRTRSRRCSVTGRIG